MYSKYISKSIKVSMLFGSSSPNSTFSFVSLSHFAVVWVNTYSVGKSGDVNGKIDLHLSIMIHFSWTASDMKLTIQHFLAATSRVYKN